MVSSAVPTLEMAVLELLDKKPMRMVSVESMVIAAGVSLPLRRSSDIDSILPAVLSSVSPQALAMASNQWPLGLPLPLVLPLLLTEGATAIMFKGVVDEFKSFSCLLIKWTTLSGLATCEALQKRRFKRAFLFFLKLQRR